jgi:hypothetical protein
VHLHPAIEMGPRTVLLRGGRVQLGVKNFGIEDDRHPVVLAINGSIPSSHSAKKQR